MRILPLYWLAIFLCYHIVGNYTRLCWHYHGGSTSMGQISLEMTLFFLLRKRINMVFVIPHIFIFFMWAIIFLLHNIEVNKESTPKVSQFLIWKQFWATPNHLTRRRLKVVWGFVFPAWQNREVPRETLKGFPKVRTFSYIQL